MNQNDGFGHGTGLGYHSSHLEIVESTPPHSHCPGFDLGLENDIFQLILMHLQVVPCAHMMMSSDALNHMSLSESSKEEPFRLWKVSLY